MHISDELLCYLEELSRLSLSPAEKEAVKKDLSDILNYMQQLDTLPPEAASGPFGSTASAAGCNATALPFGGLAPREDRAAEPTSAEDLLQNAPDREGPYFRVPKAL